MEKIRINFNLSPYKTNGIGAAIKAAFLAGATAVGNYNNSWIKGYSIGSGLVSCYNIANSLYNHFNSSDLMTSLRLDHKMSLLFIPDNTPDNSIFFDLGNLGTLFINGLYNDKPFVDNTQGKVLAGLGLALLVGKEIYNSTLDKLSKGEIALFVGKNFILDAYDIKNGYINKTFNFCNDKDVDFGKFILTDKHQTVKDIHNVKKVNRIEHEDGTVEYINDSYMVKEMEIRYYYKITDFFTAKIRGDKDGFDCYLEEYQKPHSYDHMECHSYTSYT